MVYQGERRNRKLVKGRELGQAWRGRERMDRQRGHLGDRAHANGGAWSGEAGPPAPKK